MINSSAEIQPHCLSAEFCTLGTKLRIIICMSFQLILEKLFSGFDNPCKKFLLEVIYENFI
ncbi:hypothetical protein E4N81_10785 [Treponema denticola]|uniref:hypothetical protein n=1 Tax=Treponema denticola TaxID=158 RepID=UPI003D6E8139